MQKQRLKTVVFAALIMALTITMLIFSGFQTVDAFPFQGTETPGESEDGRTPSTANIDTVADFTFTDLTQTQADALAAAGVSCTAGETCQATASQTIINTLKQNGIEYTIDREALVYTYGILDDVNETGLSSAGDVSTQAVQSIFNSNDTDVQIPDASGGQCSFAFTSLSLSGAPTGAVLTDMEYRIRIVHTWPGDLIVELTNDVVETAIWNSLGGSTDGGFDDDSENDEDIYLNQRTAPASFRGQPVNDVWYMDVRDCATGDIGNIDYMQLWAYYESGPSIDVNPLSIAMNINRNNSNSVVSSGNTVTLTRNTPLPSEPTIPQQQNPPANSYMPGKLVVVPFDGVSAASVNNVFAANNVSVDRVTASGTYVLNVTPGDELSTAQSMMNTSVVRYAEPLFIYSTQIEPNDPRYDEQWAWDMVNAPAAWDITTGSSDVVIAILDTGGDLDHPDLDAQITNNGYDFAYDDNIPNDVDGHGSHVGGTVAAETNNGTGVAGFAWGSRLMMLKVLDDSGSGSNADIADAIRYAADNGADIINMSLGGSGFSQLLQDAINYAHGQGVLIVASSGNCGDPNTFFLNGCPTFNVISYPAAMNNVMSVGSTNQSDDRSSFSSFNEFVDISAPGSSILSTVPNNTYATYSGTSMASPHVAGLAALILSLDPTLTNDEVQQIIQDTSVDRGTAGRDDSFGHGRIDALAALMAVGADRTTGEITVANTGSSNLSITGVNNLNADCWLGISLPSGLPITVTPGNSITIDVSLLDDCVGAGNYNGTVRIFSNDSDSSIVDVAVSAAITGVSNSQCVDKNDKVGIFRSGDRRWQLNNTADGSLADNSFIYGTAGLTPLSGDWNADGYDTIGYRSGTTFHLNNQNNNSNAEYNFSFGTSGEIPIVGDWNADGYDTVGVYNRTTAQFKLRNAHSSGAPSNTFTFGSANNNDIPIVGDWNGDNRDTIGLYDPDTGRFSLRNSNSGGSADITFLYGSTSEPWVPVVGDWDADGVDTIGLYNPNVGKFILRNSNEGGAIEMTFFYYFGATGEIPLVGNWEPSGDSSSNCFEMIDHVGIFLNGNNQWRLNHFTDGSLADSQFVYGPSNITPLSGDWDGDGDDTIGYRSGTTFSLNNQNNNSNAEYVFSFGTSNEIPIVGDWDGDGDDTIGVYNQTTGEFKLRNFNSAGAANMTFVFGSTNTNDIPIVGDWNGDNIDTIGLYDPDTGRFSLRNFNSAGAANLSFIYGSTSAPWVPVAGDWDGDLIDTIGLYNPNVGKFILRNSNEAGSIEYFFFYYYGASNETPLVGNWTTNPGSNSVPVVNDPDTQAAEDGWFAEPATAPALVDVLEPGVYEIEDYTALLNGEWALQDDAEASNGAYATSDTGDISFLFAGSGLELTYAAPVDADVVYVELDGQVYQTGGFPDNDVMLFDLGFTFTNLDPNTVHEVRIYTENGPIAIDKFIITD